MIGGLVPDGPLHPGDALVAAVAGAVLGVVFRRRAGAWVVAVVAGAWVVLRWRYASVVGDAVAGRDRPALDLALLALPAVGLAIRRVRTGPVARATLAALAAVWALVPDTEAPLVAGVLLATAIAGPIVAGRSEDRTRLAGMLLVLPTAAALVGTAGRPAQHGPALFAAVATALGVAIVEVALRRVARQRAGTPTTVVEGSTSSVTTAPAPTTAP